MGTSTLSSGLAESRGDHPAGSAVLPALFLLALLLPINFELAGLRMNPSRLFLLLCAIPFAIQVFGGKAGRITWVDVSMVGFAVMIVATLLFHHGAGQLGYGLSQVLETLGGYMTGRVLIRSVPDYRRFVRFFLLALLVMLPFAVDELFHFRMLLADAFDGLFSVVKKNPQTRLELSRVQVVFPHAILYGLYCSLAFASILVLYRKQPFRRLVYLGLVGVMTLLSLSSAPVLSILLQAALYVWGWVTRGAWTLLAAIAGFIFLLLQLFTNRGAFVIFVENMTFDPATGWWRIHIWTWGSRTVMNHPLLGIGLNDWVRPEWLTYSVDNFWLLMAMRHGLIGLAFLLVAFGLHLTFLLRVKNLAPDASLLRMGYSITLFGLIFTLSTVHVWDAMAVFVMFFLGAGAFLYTAPASASEPETGDAGPAEGALRRALPFSRFPQTPGPGRQSGREDGTRGEAPRARRGVPAQGGVAGK